MVYRVKSGDVLGTIARKHGVKVSQLKAWNDLKSTTIRVGQRLIIHADPNTL
jgi:membrane-bound lytic murein transglycosylase D